MIGTKKRASASLREVSASRRQKSLKQASAKFQRASATINNRARACLVGASCDVFINEALVNPCLLNSEIILK